MLTLITVNYNCAEHTTTLLRSLERQTNRHFSVIVVDNDSSPEDRALLGEYAITSPLALDIMYSDTNRGFAGGNNMAVRKALASGATGTLLINPDTEVGPTFIADLPELEHEPAIWGIPLDEGGHIAYAGLVKWLRSTLPHVYETPPLATHASNRLYPIGGGMLVHRDAWDAVGLLDERYFLYFEDADFGMRTQKTGVPVHFLSQPTIRHAVSATTRALGNPLLLRYHIRNALLFNREHGPVGTGISLHIWSFFTMLKQFVKIVVMPAQRRHSRAILAGITDFYAGNFGKITQTNRDRV